MAIDQFFEQRRCPANRIAIARCRRTEQQHPREPMHISTRDRRSLVWSPDGIDPDLGLVLTTGVEHVVPYGLTCPETGEMWPRKDREVISLTFPGEHGFVPAEQLKVLGVLPPDCAEYDYMQAWVGAMALYAAGAERSWSIGEAIPHDEGPSFTRNGEYEKRFGR